MKPSICLVTPALANANNGNWQTASRWARLLRPDYRVQLMAQWPSEAGAGLPKADLMLALHARRSSASIQAWHAQMPDKPLAVVLTGTDLYRDILVDATAQHSLVLADRLVVLHEGAPQDLPAALRPKTTVCFQSCSARRTLDKPKGHLRALMVGHLRSEKDPETYFAAARELAHRSDIRLDHIGAALDEKLGAQAQALMAESLPSQPPANHSAMTRAESAKAMAGLSQQAARQQPGTPHYRWLGALAHGATRTRIQRAHILVHCSRMEGGAHVVMEAVRSGTPVIASRIPGNVGMLGMGYKGYFEPGDAKGLARLLERVRDDPTALNELQMQCAQRAGLFEPAHERAVLKGLLSQLLGAAS